MLLILELSGGGFSFFKSKNDSSTYDHSNESYWAVLSRGTTLHARPDGSAKWNGVTERVTIQIWKLLSDSYPEHQYQSFQRYW